MFHTTPRNRAIVWGCVVIAVIANVAGYVWNLYDRWWFFDDVLHGFTIFALTLPLGLLLCGIALISMPKQRWILALVIASLGVAVGAWWEIAEWGFDQFVAGNVILGKTDTIIDLIMDTIGAMLAGILAARMVRP